MAGGFSGHLVDSFERSFVSHGPMSYNANMHGTQQTQPFSIFGSQGTMAYQEMSEATAMKIASLQAKLNQKLGPEYISQRPGPGGGPKLTYAEGWKIINLANEVFGFNGWSSTVVSLTTDFMDYNEESRRHNIGVTAIVRVTLRDGVFHEDIGYGMIENTKSKGQGLDKCKKEAVTDGLKRALRSFGNLMGNCLYDKSYTQEVVKMKVTPAKFNKDQLHRRPEFDEVKPNIASSSTSYASSSTSSNQSMSASTSASSSHAPYPRQQQTNNKPAPVVVKREPTTPSVNPSSAPPARPPQPPNNQRSMPPPPLPAAARPAQPQPQQERHVSFTNTEPLTVTSASFSGAQIDGDDSFTGFSEDDAFFASVELEGDIGAPIPNEDLGRPIEEDTDMGPPLHYPDTSVESVSAPPPPAVRAQQPNPNAPNRPNSRTSGSRSRLEAIIAAQMEQDRLNGLQNHSSSSSVTMGSSSDGASAEHQPGPSRITLPPANNGGGYQHPQRHTLPSGSHNSENRDPMSGQRQSLGGDGAGNVKRMPAPVGGFHFPPGMPNPLQSGSGVGVKRPLEATTGGGQRGMRPGMWLQQAMAASSDSGVNGRQVLGRLDTGESGDVKRVRR
ncbi:RAD52 DNA repair protein [Ephemerocybe angulata]|uniref:RAD52 DNA repair protein n=1 Tax=Ephemerocybe angulata TaxID=980116 RepID=A0A8H6IHN0_9AGAR|nr:RAD52 DNA repair protein [Tulosesus angulatus]